MGKTKQGTGLWARICGACLAVLLLLPLFSPAQAAESADTLRVAFPLQRGSAMMDESGRRSGYAYEYLQEIAQYTGWNYEFYTFDGSDNAALMNALSMLEKGELDLVPGVLYSEALAEMYEYTASSYGSVYTVLAVSEGNETINENTLLQGKRLRIAAHENAKTRMEEARQFCAMSGVEAQFVFCDSNQEQIEAVRLGKADVLLSVDISLPEGLRSVARFAPRPYYFIATKGESQLTTKLNAAIVNTNEADPYFAVGLYEKYFGGQITELLLSEEEKSYVRGVSAVRVAVFGDRMPIQDVNPATGEYEGLTREVFDYIAQATNLQFQFVPVAGMEELPAMLEAGTVDLVAGMPYDYEAAELYGLVMSRPYFDAQTTYALREGVDAGNLRGKHLAITKGMVAPDGLTGQVTRYDTVSQCLDALERGKADFAYSDSYAMQYYASQKRYQKLTLIPQAGVTQKICIGLNKPVDATLLTILNKAIRSVPENDLRAMLYRNTTTQVKVTLESFVADNPWLVLGSILAVALVIIGLLYIYYRNHIRMTRRSALENERYKQLSELTNEHIFEYEFARDRLTLSERSAKELGAPRVREEYYYRLGQDTSDESTQERTFIEQLIRVGSNTGELNVIMQDGTRRWFRVAAKVVADTQGKPVLAVGRMTDIQNEREELERLAEKARRDSLTGVYNGTTTRQIATRCLKEHEGGALLVLDIDAFKAVNDQNGHFVGDQALCALAQLLEDTFRRSDVVGRLGGDEFVVFMDRITEPAVVENKCRQVLAGMGNLPGGLKGLGLTVSIGAAMATEGEEYNSLYQRADAALYQVKEHEKNGFCLVE